MNFGLPLFFLLDMPSLSSSAAFRFFTLEADLPTDKSGVKEPFIHGLEVGAGCGVDGRDIAAEEGAGLDRGVAFGELFDTGRLILAPPAVRACALGPCCTLDKSEASPTELNCAASPFERLLGNAAGGGGRRG